MPFLYKSLPRSKESYRIEYELGKWHKIDGDLKMCANGFHASTNIIDAMLNVDCGYIARVEVRGKCLRENTKECWSEMKIIEWHEWKRKDALPLAIFLAEMVLENYESKFPLDKRPRKAIETAEKCLKDGRNIDFEKIRKIEERTIKAVERTRKRYEWSVTARNSALAARYTIGTVIKPSMAAWASMWASYSASWAKLKIKDQEADRIAILEKCHQFVRDNIFSID
ncbi:MAG: hypothetical protein AB2L22_12835 [Syntrophales bacterium]